MHYLKNKVLQMTKIQHELSLFTTRIEGEREVGEGDDFHGFSAN